MKNPKKQKYTLKDAGKFFEEVLKHAPADDGKTYLVTFDGYNIPLSGGVINRTYASIMANSEVPGEDPADEFARKYNALKLLIKYELRYYVMTEKREHSIPELFELQEINEAIKNDRVNEDTIKIARKYLKLPPLPGIKIN